MDKPIVGNIQFSCPQCQNGVTHTHDTAEIAGTIAGLNALRDEQIADLTARLAEAERKAEHYEAEWGKCSAYLQKVADERDELRAKLAEAEHARGAPDQNTSREQPAQLLPATRRD